jgi:hypothetical protein
MFFINITLILNKKPIINHKNKTNKNKNQYQLIQVHNVTLKNKI